MKPADPPRFSEFIRLTAWCGLVYGLVEALESGLLSLIPGALSWRTGNSIEVFWFAPLFYLMVATALGFLLWPLARVLRIRRPDIIMVVLVAFGGGYLAARLQGQVFGRIAALLLGAGIAVVSFRIYRRWENTIRSAIRRSFAPLLGLVGVIALVTLGLPRLGGGSAAPDSAGAGSTNVLLIVLDTQRADHLSTYGYGRETSPRIDSLAQSGTVFENATAASSWTLPTHATLMTGKLPHDHRAGEMRRPYLDRRFVTLAEVLKRKGYATGGFVANTYWTGRQTGLARGFDHYEDFYGNPGDALVRTVLGRWLAYDFLPRFGLSDIPGRKRGPAINRDLLAWLDRHQGQPFFAFLNYFDVHAPFLPPAPYAGRFSGRRAEDYRSGREINVGALTAEMKMPPDSVLRTFVDAYDESLLSLDAALGDLAEELNRRGLLDRTLIIITSDHGESFGGHNFLFHGQSLYRDQTHVPLILRLPGQVPSGIRADWPVGLEQVPATVMRYVDPADRTFPEKPLLEPDTAAAILSELARRAGLPAGWPSSNGSVAASTTRRFHFIQTQNGPGELYDIVTDPSELTDLVNDPAYATVVAGFRRALEEKLADTGLPWGKR
jgi:arylsulfatase A-like enzyme